MSRTTRRLLIALIAAAVITGATFFVGEYTIASIPGTQGMCTSAGSADVYGFPIPYVTFFSYRFSCYGPTGSVSLDNTYFYNPLALLADYAIWLVISVVAVSTFTVRRLLLAAAVGAGITIATLLLAPLSIVAPPPGGASTAILKSMGFPYEYLVYSVSGLPGFGGFASYAFYPPPFLADLALWTGLACVIGGIVVSLLQMRQHRSLVLDQTVRHPQPDRPLS